MMLLSVSFQLQSYNRNLIDKLTLGSLATFGILNEARLIFLFAGRLPRQLSAGILRMVLVAIVIILNEIF